MDVARLQTLGDIRAQIESLQAMEASHAEYELRGCAVAPAAIRAATSILIK